MKIPNKQELQQIAFNSSPYINFRKLKKKIYKYFTKNIYKKCTAIPYCFSVIDAFLQQITFLLFRENLVERISKLIMEIEDKSKHGKLQYDINREAAKILPLSSGKIEKFEYLTGEEVLPSNRRKIVKLT